MRTRLFLFALAFCLATGPAASAADDFKLYLVRHAEKQSDGGRDPALTEGGKQRAVYLAAWLKDKGIDDIYSSNYRRTAATAQPLATELGHGVKVYDPGNQASLVKKLLDRRDNALVVGHSNTIPELARVLCDCEIADMDEAEYDRLIIVTVNSGHASIETLNQTELH